MLWWRRVVCMHIGQTHCCTASWKVEEGIRTMSLWHLVQHRQKLDGMSWLKKRGKTKRGDMRVIMWQMLTSKHIWERLFKKKPWCGITCLLHWVNNSSITSARPQQHHINTMATLNRSGSVESCWGKRNWRKQIREVAMLCRGHTEGGLKGWMVASLWTTDQWPWVVDGCFPTAWVEEWLMRKSEGVLT